MHIPVKCIVILDSLAKLLTGEASGKHISRLIFS
jgi:hypothetical protein